MVVGLVCALGAALAYGAGSILQSVGARRSTSVSGLDPRLMVRLATQSPYLAGTALDLLGFLASVVALQTLPLFLVQSLVAGSVGVTAAIAAVLGARLRRREVVCLVVLSGGLVLLAASAQPEAATPLSTALRWVLLASIAVVGAVGWAGARMTGPASSSLLAVGTGLGFSVVAIAARTLVVPSPLWHLLLDPALWAVVLHGSLAMLLFATALQRGSVTTATAVTFAVETVLPALAGLLLLGDTARPGFAPLAMTGFLLAIVGAAALALAGEPEIRAPVPSAAYDGRAPLV